MKFPTEKHIQELDKDKFGYKTLSKKLLDEILLKMELPNVFGLYGNWGTGKTTILGFIKQYLSDKSEEEYKKITAVYFEPWKYEYSDQKDLLFALLSSIKRQVKIEGKKWKRLMTDITVISSGILRKTGIIDLKEVKEDFDILEDLIFDEHENWVDKIEGIRNSFETVIKAALKKESTTKLFVFIDDLDRCLPENTVKLLEGIKNFLSVNNTLFVLAIDRRIVSEMVENKYGLHYGYGDEYLMKIVHYYYDLPSVSLKNLAKDILTEYDIDFSENQIDYLVNFLENEAKEPRLAKHILHQLGTRMKLSKESRNLLSEDGEGKQLQYTFVASYLLTKFPKLFSIGDPIGLLKNILRSSQIILGSGNGNDEYRKSTEYYPIDSDTRKKLENIIMRHPINLGNEASPNRLINDIDKLSRSIKSLRTYS